MKKRKQNKDFLTEKEIKMFNDIYKYYTLDEYLKDLERLKRKSLINKLKTWIQNKLFPAKLMR